MAVKLGNGNWAVKENKLLAYNDNSGRFFNKEFDFSRGSIATYVGKDGLIKSAASDVPRIDFSDSTNGVLLLEKAATNLVTYSEDFSNAAWAKSNSSVVSGFTSPNGDASAFELIIQSSNGYLLEQISYSAVTGQSVTASIFAKNEITGFLAFGGATVAGTDVYSIEDYGNGWFRHTTTRTFTTTFVGSIQFIIYGQVGNNVIFGAQLEQGYATSYIPSLSGSATTRLADVCNNSGSAQDFNSEEGVLYIQAKVKSDSNSSINSIGISNGTDSNRLSIIMYGNSDLIRANMNVSSVSQFDFLQYGNNPEQYYKIAVSYKQNDCKIFINGVKVGVDISATMPSLGTFDRLNLDIGNNLYDFYGKVKDLQVFTEAKSDEQLAALTTI